MSHLAALGRRMSLFGSQRRPAGAVVAADAGGSEASVRRVSKAHLREGAVAAAAAAVGMGRLVVEVVDTGAGISPENQKKLFKEVIQFSPEKLQGARVISFVCYSPRSLLDSQSHTCTNTHTPTLIAFPLLSQLAVALVWGCGSPRVSWICTGAPFASGAPARCADPTHIVNPRTVVSHASFLPSPSCVRATAARFPWRCPWPRSSLGGGPSTRPTPTFFPRAPRGPATWVPGSCLPVAKGRSWPPRSGR